MPELLPGTPSLFAAALILWAARQVYEIVKSELARRGHADAPSDYISELRKDIKQLQDQLTKILTALTGLNGDNGILGEIKSLRERMHAVEGSIGVCGGSVNVLTQRMSEVERDVSEFRRERIVG